MTLRVSFLMSVKTILSPSSTRLPKPGLASSSLCTFTPSSSRASSTVAAVSVFLTGFLPAIDEGELLGGHDLQRRTGAVEVATTAQRQLGAVEAAADLLERGVDVGGGDPVRLGLAVDGQLEGTAVAHADLAALLDRVVERGRDLVVLAELDAFVGQDVADGRGAGADLALLTVDGQGDGVGHRGVAEGRAGHGEHHHGGQRDHPGAAAGHGRGKVADTSHSSPGSCSPGLDPHRLPSAQHLYAGGAGVTGVQDGGVHEPPAGTGGTMVIPAVSTPPHQRPARGPSPRPPT